MPGLKFHVTSLICKVTGGPCNYTGRTIKEAHADLNITEREWQALLSDFRRVLNSYDVPQREQKELIAIMVSLKKEIVGPAGGSYTGRSGGVIHRPITLGSPGSCS